MRNNCRKRSLRDSEKLAREYFEQDKGMANLPSNFRYIRKVELEFRRKDGTLESPIHADVVFDADDDDDSASDEEEMDHDPAASLSEDWI